MDMKKLALLSGIALLVLALLAEHIRRSLVWIQIYPYPQAYYFWKYLPIALALTGFALIIYSATDC